MLNVNLYIDIDGVLLDTRHQSVPIGGCEFVEFIINNFHCYWLTTHCHGDCLPAISYLSFYYPPKMIDMLRRIAPTSWDTLKTEAIDFSKPFVWLDDYAFQAEKGILKIHDAEDCLVLLNLNRTNELNSIKQKLSLMF